MISTLLQKFNKAQHLNVKMTLFFQTMHNHNNRIRIAKSKNISKITIPIYQI